MGVGRSVDILKLREGIDMFDCVIPIFGRNGRAIRF